MITDLQSYSNNKKSFVAKELERRILNLFLKFLFKHLNEQHYPYYLDIKAITTLLCLLLVLYVLFPSIHSFFYITTALLKSDVFRHSKACSSHSFQPIGIRLCSF